MGFQELGAARNTVDRTGLNLVEGRSLVYKSS
jgi:hypothetical protein